MSKAKLPRWECLDKRDAQEMIKWVNGELDQMEEKRKRFLRYGDEHSGLITEERAIEQGYNGNIEPLRQMYPDLAMFLHPPKLKRGRPSKGNEGDAVKDAALDVKAIRKLWKKHFKKRNRPLKDRVTAEQIAADRWGVDVAVVVARLKKPLLDNG
jgi:hypothetical protein